MWFKNCLTLSLILLFALSACGQNPTKDSASSFTPEPASPTTEITLTPTSSPSWWHPTVGLAWQWNINSTEVDTSIEADVYDIDLYVPQSTIDELHAKGRKVICYMSVGSWEDWRPDNETEVTTDKQTMQVLLSDKSRQKNYLTSSVGM